MSSKKLNKLKVKLIGLLEQISTFELMLPGNYLEVYLKCGKKNCWCYKAQNGHLFKRITWSEEGKIKTKAIRKENIKWVKMTTANYRKFRKKRKEFFMLIVELRNELNKYEKKVVKKTRRERNY